MRINAHSHIFNLKSVFTQETMDILLRRVTDIDMPELLKSEVQTLLTDAITKAGNFTEVESMLEKFVKEIAIGEKLKEFGGDHPVNLELIGGDLLEKVGVELLSNLLKRVTRIVNSAVKDARDQHSFEDLLDLLIIGLKPSIAAVTSRIMRQLSNDDVIVALMMDITKGGNQDQALFNQQIKDTADQIPRYPGRILPFIAVNPLRDDHRLIMERALLSNGFVGVKLYPSLGYSVNSQPMQEVYRYCHTRDIPILMHCSNGGFYADEAFRKNSEPKLWKPILKKFKGLKICFGHFGGAESLCGADIEPNSWTQQILELMENPENKGVYADISFHSEPMKNGAMENNYFKNLKLLLNSQVFGDRILFGTDFWLVRMVLTEKNYWEYFESTLNDKNLFVKMTSTNPKRYLGISDVPGQSNENIKNYIKFIADHQSVVDPEAASQWVIDEINSVPGLNFEWKSLPSSSRWSANNEAHVRLFWYLRDNQMYAGDAETAKFAASPHFSVTNLQYWNKEFESGAIFYGKCEAVAKGLDRYFASNHAAYEGLIDRDVAIGKLIDSLADEGTRFIDLGRLCDELYNFASERA
jgi:predicted TIM-barrel fold metal-dependent hydrolase